MIQRAWANREPCCICGGEFMSMSDITAEHLQPLRNGRNNDLANLAPAHRGCNTGWNRGQRTGRGSS